MTHRPPLIRWRDRVSLCLVRRSVEFEFEELPDWTFAAGALADYPGLKTGPISSTLGGQRPEVCNPQLRRYGNREAFFGCCVSPFENFSIGLQTILYSGPSQHRNRPTVMVLFVHSRRIQITIVRFRSRLTRSFAGTGVGTSVRMELGADRFGL